MSGSLHILESAALLIVAVLEFPKHAKWTKAHAQDSMVAITDSRRRLDDLHRFPRRCQPPERSALGVPKKKTFGRSFDLR
jgi:hypothetical protein